MLCVFSLRCDRGMRACRIDARRDVMAETCCDISKSMSSVVYVVARVPQSRAATTTRTDGKVRVILCEIQIVRVASSQ